MDPRSESTLEDCFNYSYDEGYRTTQRFLRSRGAREDTAEEIAQAAWAKGWEYRFQLHHPELLLAWINSIAKNMLKRKIQLEHHIGEMKETNVPTIPSSTSSDAFMILASCDPRDADILYAYYFYGFTTKEIACKFDMRPTTVRVKLFRLRRTLRDRFSRMMSSSRRRKSGDRSSGITRAFPNKEKICC